MKKKSWLDRLEEWDIKRLKNKAAKEKEREKEERERMAKNGIQIVNYDMHKNCDSVYTMDNDEATILYIVVMIVGAIFEDRWLIWIAATFIYYMHITRHNRR